MLLDAGAYLTPEEFSPEMVSYTREVSERIEEIPVKDIKTPEDLKSSAVKLATEEFSSAKTHKRRLDELVRILNDTQDRFDQTYMPLDCIIDQLMLTKQIRTQMMELLFPQEVYQKKCSLSISEFFSKSRELQKGIMMPRFKNSVNDNYIHIGKILKLMLPFMEAVNKEEISNDEPEPEVDYQPKMAVSAGNQNTLRIKYDKEKGKHVTKVITVETKKDRLKSLKKMQKVNKTFDIDDKISQIHEILNKLSEETDSSKITSRSYLINLVKKSEIPVTLLVDSFKDLQYLYDFHNGSLNAEISNDFYGLRDYGSQIPSFGPNTVWLLNYLTIKTDHQKEIVGMGLQICLDLLKSKPTSSELELLQKAILQSEESKTSMSEEKKWSVISGELLKTAKGMRFVQKILENYSKLSCLETVLYDRFIIESSAGSK